MIEPSPELMELAGKVREILAAFPEDDPTIVEFKKSPEYQKVAIFLEQRTQKRSWLCAAGAGRGRTAAGSTAAGPGHWLLERRLDLGILCIRLHRTAAQIWFLEAGGHAGGYLLYS